jgi:hypothetical protein
MLAKRKDLGQRRASEAGTGSKSPHPNSVILTKASKARGAEGPRTASRSEAGTGSKSPHPNFRHLDRKPLESKDLREAIRSDPLPRFARDDERAIVDSRRIGENGSREQ